MWIFLWPVAVLLTLAAAAELVFGSRDWPPREKRFARVAILLLFVAEAGPAIMVGTTSAFINQHPAVVAAVAMCCAAAGCVAALFTTDRFRWFAAIGGIACVVGLLPILGIFSANAPLT